MVLSRGRLLKKDFPFLNEYSPEDTRESTAAIFLTIVVMSSKMQGYGSLALAARC